MNKCQTKIQIERERERERERPDRLPGNPEIHETSGVGCPPLTNLSRLQHRCVRVLRRHTQQRSPAVSSCSAPFSFCPPDFLSPHSVRRPRFRFLFPPSLLPLCGGCLLTFNALSRGSYKELRRWTEGRSVLHWQRLG